MFPVYRWKEFYQIPEESLNTCHLYSKPLQVNRIPWNASEIARDSQKLYYPRNQIILTFLRFSISGCIGICAKKHGTSAGINLAQIGWWLSKKFIRNVTWTLRCIKARDTHVMGSASTREILSSWRSRRLKISLCIVYSMHRPKRVLYRLYARETSYTCANTSVPVCNASIAHAARE